MATHLPHRPLASLTQCLRQLHLDSLPRRTYATATDRPATTPAPYARLHNFHPGNIYRNHREKAAHFRPLPVPRVPPAIKKTCPDPVSTVTAGQLAALDPTGARARLFSPLNPERVRVGDVVLVRLGGGLEPMSGAVLAVRRKTPVDAALLLRNTLTRVAVEAWVKIYSPAVRGIEVVRRAQRRPRRNKLFYFRDPKHDPGSLEGVVRAYTRSRQGLGQQRAGKIREQVKGRKR